MVMSVAYNCRLTHKFDVHVDYVPRTTQSAVAGQPHSQLPYPPLPSPCPATTTLCAAAPRQKMRPSKYAKWSRHSRTFYILHLKCCENKNTSQLIFAVHPNTTTIKLNASHSSSHKNLHYTRTIYMYFNTL